MVRREPMTLRLFLLPLLPLLGAAGLAVAGSLGARGLAWVAGLVSLGATLLTLSLAPEVLRGVTPTAVLPWVPSAGLDVSLAMDGLSLLFALLISGIGVLIVTYARAYMGDGPGLQRFYASLLLFQAAMLGVVTAANLLLLVVFWELTSISSFLLIGLRDEQPAARAGAYQALIVTGAGGLCLLAGVLILGGAAGTYEWSQWLARTAELRALPVAPLAMLLMLLGAATKSAQVPFHFWLPSAMAAPTPVSAYLHSATMVKAGIFLVARLSPLFAPTDLWFYSLTVAGAATMLVGGWGALRQTDLKALLAYSTISQLGLIMTLLGCGGEIGAVAATFHVLNHAMFKAPLFMAAGIVDHEAHTRDLRRLGGLGRHMPRTAAIVYLAGSSMAGMILLNGFLSKELFFEAMVEQARHGLWGGALPWIALVASTLTVAYTLRLVVGAFLGDDRRLEHEVHEAPASLRRPAELLVLGCIAVGVLPGWLAEPLVAAAASAVHGSVIHVHLALWHGLTIPLAMSVTAIAAGAGYYFARQDPTADPPPPHLRPAAESYDRGIAQLLHGARRLTDMWQTGHLRTYLRIVLIATLLLSVGGVLAAVPPTPSLPMTPPVAGATGITLLTMAAAIAVAAYNRRRLASVVALAAVGLLVAVYFVWLSAPDLVITQLLVETVSTILIVLVLYFLPKEIPGREPRPRLFFDGALSLAIGAGVAAAVYAVIRLPFRSISAVHLAKSWSEAGGHNAVNVILVDFRGYDTLGEITVLAIAALGVVALIRAGRRPA